MCYVGILEDLIAFGGQTRTKIGERDILVVGRISRLNEDGILCAGWQEERVAGDEVGVFDIAGVCGKWEAEKYGQHEIPHDPPPAR